MLSLSRGLIKQGVYIMKKIIVAAVSALFVTSLFASATLSLSKPVNDNSSTVYVNIESTHDVYGVQFDLLYNTTDLSLEASEISSMINGIDGVYAKVKEEAGFVKSLFTRQDIDEAPIFRILVERVGKNRCIVKVNAESKEFEGLERDLLSEINQSLS